MDKSRKLIIPIFITIVVAVIALLLEIYTLPKIYEGIPLPFPRTGKPIGGVLFPATFLHIIIGYGGILVILSSIRKAGFNVHGLLPSTKKGVVETIALLIFLLSGFLLWWFPPALIPFIVTGIYLIFLETK